MNADGYFETKHSMYAINGHPHGLTIDPANNIAIALFSKAGTIAVFDIEAEDLLGTVPVGKTPQGIAIDGDLKVAVVGNTHDSTITIIDLATFDILAKVPLNREPGNISINTTSHEAFVVHPKDNSLSVIDLLTCKIIGHIPVGKGSIDLALDTELGIGIVVNEKDSMISIIDLHTYQVIKRLPTGNKPNAVDINPKAHVAAITNEKDNSITVIDLLTWDKTDIGVDKHPSDIVINRLDNHALVVCGKPRILMVKDLSLGSSVHRYHLETQPWAVAVDHLSNKALVVDDKTESLTFIQLDNPLPVLASLTPDHIERGTESVSITIEGKGFTRSSLVTISDVSPVMLETEFIDNNHLRATLSREMVSKAGEFYIAVSNPEPAGGISNCQKLTVYNPVPFITALDPAEAIAVNNKILLTLIGTGFFEDTHTYIGGMQKPVVYLNNSTLLIDMNLQDLQGPGMYDILTFNPGPGGGNSNSVIFTLKQPLELTITAPLNGETINKAGTHVRGTVRSSSTDMGITVNGVPATISEDEWIVNNIPLSPGENAITATATDALGFVSKKTIAIHTEHNLQEVMLRANVFSGIAPLQIHFLADTNHGVPFTVYRMDFDGDGAVDYSGASFQDISHTYPQEGVYYPELTATDQQANTYSDRIAIVVFSASAMNEMLLNKWEKMTCALKNSRVEDAVSHFLGSSQERYRSLFMSLMDILPEIVLPIDSLELVALEDGVAEYRLKTTEDAEEVTYYIYFALDNSGIWKIQQF